MKLFSGYSVIFSHIMFENINFYSTLGVLHIFENSAFHLFSLASRQLQRLECMDASICSHVSCYVEK